MAGRLAGQGAAGGQPRPLVAIFAGNHGVVARGVSAYPAAVTRQMVDNFAAGGAAINQICLAYDLGLKVYDLALDHADRRHHHARRRSTRRPAPRPWPSAWRRSPGGVDLLCIGEMGIGNTTIAAAIFNALFGGTARRLGRARHRRRRRGHRAQARAPSPPPSPSMPAISTIRWKCCAVSAGARSRRWPERSSPRA